MLWLTIERETDAASRPGNSLGNALPYAATWLEFLLRPPFP